MWKILAFGRRETSYPTYVLWCSAICCNGGFSQKSHSQSDNKLDHGLSKIGSHNILQPERRRAVFMESAASFACNEGGMTYDPIHRA